MSRLDGHLLYRRRDGHYDMDSHVFRGRAWFSFTPPDNAANISGTMLTLKGLLREQLRIG